jgi:hypothetical protein
MTAFGAATRQNFTAVCGCHAGAKTVYAFTFQVARLKSSFHGDVPKGFDAPSKFSNLKFAAPGKTNAAFYRIRPSCAIDSAVSKRILKRKRQASPRHGLTRANS